MRDPSPLHSQPRGETYQDVNEIILQTFSLCVLVWEIYQLEVWVKIAPLSTATGAIISVFLYMTRGWNTHSKTEWSNIFFFYLSTRWAVLPSFSPKPRGEMTRLRVHSRFSGRYLISTLICACFYWLVHRHLQPCTLDNVFERWIPDISPDKCCL